MKILYIAFCSLSASITFSGWMLGYVMAHNEISSKCERLGGFYVGPKTYTCQIKKTQHNTE